MRSKVKAFIKSAREIAQAGLVVASSGNLSWRVGEDEILISRRTSWLGELKEKDVVRYPLTGVGGQKERVSCEIALHQKVLQKRKDVMVVLHFQSPAATALACWKKRIENFFFIPEVPAYLGSIGYVPYCPPGSTQLAEEVSTAVEKNNLLILRNHGQVVVGKDFREVKQRAIFFELAAKILLFTRGEIQTIPKKEVDFIYQFALDRKKT